MFMFKQSLILIAFLALGKSADLSSVLNSMSKQLQLQKSNVVVSNSKVTDNDSDDNYRTFIPNQITGSNSGYDWSDFSITTKSNNGNGNSNGNSKKAVNLNDVVAAVPQLKSVSSGDLNKILGTVNTVVSCVNTANNANSNANSNSNSNSYSKAAIAAAIAKKNAVATANSASVINPTEQSPLLNEQIIYPTINNNSNSNSNPATIPSNQPQANNEPPAPIPSNSVQKPNSQVYAQSISNSAKAVIYNDVDRSQPSF